MCSLVYEEMNTGDCLSLGLRGDEHRRLSFANLQIKTDEDTARYLEYTESMSKTYRGRIKHRSIEPHKCRAYENNTDRCPIKIYQKYINLLPEKRDESSFYFQPLSKPKPHMWFSLQSAGHNKLEGVVKGIMSAAGSVGNFSNHSLRASTATRLYRAGVSDQLIKEQTGHRSNAIESYKRTSDIQKRNVSRVISGQPTTDVQRMEDRNVKTNIGFPYNLINCDNIANVNINIYNK